MAETSTELAPTINTGDFEELLHQLPETVAAMAQLGIRSALRFSVPEQVTLTVLPNSPITGEDHKISRVGGLISREFSGRQRRSSSPFRVISFIIANPGDIPGEGNNMLTYGVKRSTHLATRQKLNYFNLFDHSFEITGTPPESSPEAAAVSPKGFSWETDYPDSKFPDNFIERGLDLV